MLAAIVAVIVAGQVGPVFAQAADAATSPAESIDAEAARIAEPLVAEFRAAWNAHEIGRFDAIFWPDSAFIHRGGGLIEGGRNIRDYHAQLHADPRYAASRTELAIARARLLAPDVVLVTTDSKGWLNPQSEDFIASRPTFVITRQGDEWRIAFAQNTEVMSPSPD